MTNERRVRLSDLCTLGVGGEAWAFSRISNAGELRDALKWARDSGMPVHVLGGGSNVVFADEGFNGLVLHVDIRGVRADARADRTRFRAGAGEPWDLFVAATVAAECAGLECLSGIPGQVGGTPVQNVGAYGQDVSGTITCVEAMDRETLELVQLSNADCEFGYRTSRFKRRDLHRFVVTQVEFELTRKGAATVLYPDVVAFFTESGLTSPTLADVRQATLAIRRRKGMVIEPGNPANHSVGSFFVNPVVTNEQVAQVEQTAPGVPRYRVDDRLVKVPAAWLIERAGFAKGTRRGVVGVSPFQAQAIVNHGGATAADVLSLAGDIKRAVWNAFRIALVPEPVFVGFPPSAELRWLLDAEPDEYSGPQSVPRFRTDP
jgi:UDP-N-acetylmuramate dehydrogenase